MVYLILDLTIKRVRLNESLTALGIIYLQLYNRFFLIATDHQVANMFLSTSSPPYRAYIHKGSTLSLQHIKNKSTSPFLLHNLLI